MYVIGPDYREVDADENIEDQTIFLGIIYIMYRISRIGFTRICNTSKFGMPKDQEYRMTLMSSVKQLRLKLQITMVSGTYS